MQASWRPETEIVVSVMVYRSTVRCSLAMDGVGRTSGSRARPRTREEELEERCRRLEAEVAYLKKLRALAEGDGL